MGFEPWYAGRFMGFVGRGVRSVYGIAVYDSRAWKSYVDRIVAIVIAISMRRI